MISIYRLKPQFQTLFESSPVYADIYNSQLLSDSESDHLLRLDDTLLATTVAEEA